MPLPLNLFPQPPSADGPMPCTQNAGADGDPNVSTVDGSPQPFGALLEKAGGEDDLSLSPPTDDAVGTSLAPTADQLAAALAFLAVPVPPPLPLPTVVPTSSGSAESIAVGMGEAGFSPSAGEQTPSTAADFRRWLPQRPSAELTAAAGDAATFAQECRRAVNALLLKGAPTLDLQLQNGTAVPTARALTGSPVPEDASLLATPVCPDVAAAATVAAASADSTDVMGDPLQGVPIAALGNEAHGKKGSVPLIGSSRFSPSSAAREKIAGEKLVGSPETKFGGDTPVTGRKNIRLVIDEEQVTNPVPLVGTPSANRVNTMFPSRSTFDESGAAAAISSGSAANLRSHSPLPAPTHVAASHAADLVHEIREIADGMWAIDRNSVEVRFKFGDEERLNVRVEYRNGTVQATFRTDSSNLRDLIAHEWHAQSAASEFRPYRFAEPVFDASGMSADAGHQQPQQQQPRSAEQPAFSTHFSLSGLRGDIAAAAAASTPSHPDTALHLHTFA